MGSQLANNVGSTIFAAWVTLQWRHNEPMASQITSLAIVYSIVYSVADQRKHQSSATLPLWGEFTGDRWIPTQKDNNNVENVSISWRHHVFMFHWWRYKKFPEKSTYSTFHWPLATQCFLQVSLPELGSLWDAEWADAVTSPELQLPTSASR